MYCYDNEKCNLSFSKLLIILMDSYSVMRGENNKLETRAREVAPHLTDVDRDSRHHIPNFVKKLPLILDITLKGCFVIYTTILIILRPR